MDGRVRFRCISCGYDNAYSLVKKEQKTISADTPKPEKMDPELSNLTRQVVHTINQHPEVTASFVVYQGNKILLSSTQTDPDRETLVSIGRTLIEHFRLGKERFNDLTEVMLVCEDSNILYRTATKELGLAVICNDLPLPFGFKATLNQVMARLKETEAV